MPTPNSPPSPPNSPRPATPPSATSARSSRHPRRRPRRRTPHHPQDHHPQDHHPANSPPAATTSPPTSTTPPPRPTPPPSPRSPTISQGSSPAGRRASAEPSSKRSSHGHDHRTRPARPVFRVPQPGHAEGAAPAGSAVRPHTRRFAHRLMWWKGWGSNRRANASISSRSTTVVPRSTTRPGVRSSKASSGTAASVHGRSDDRAAPRVRVQRPHGLHDRASVTGPP